MKYKPEMICLWMMATFLSFNIFFLKKHLEYIPVLFYTLVFIFQEVLLKNIIKGAKILDILFMSLSP